MNHSRLCSILCFVVFIVCVSAFQGAEGRGNGNISCVLEDIAQIFDNRIINASRRISGKVKFNILVNDDSGFGKFSNNTKTIFKFKTIRNFNSYYFGFIKNGIGNGSWPHLKTRGSIEVYKGKFRLIENTRVILS